MADQSIFGVTDPELIKQAIAAQKEQGMLAQAKLSPDELMRFTAMSGSERAVQGLGGLVGGIFGVDVIDPRIKKAQMAQGVINEVNASGLDPNSPDYFASVARLAQQRGLPDLAQMSIKQAQAMQEMQAKIFKEYGLGTQAYAAAGREKEPAKVGVTADSGEVVYQQGGNQFLIRNGQRVPFQGSIRQEGGTNVKVEVKGQENVLDIDKEDAKAYRASREAASKALPVLNRMQALIDSPQGIIQGSLPEARTAFLKGLNTLGLDTSAAAKQLANTEQFRTEVGTLLQSIIKQFGYNPSNADVRFALESLPSAINSPQGLRDILDRLVKANKDTLSESTRALDYYRANKGSFSGFQPKLDLLAPSSVPSVQNLSDQQLLNMINAKKKQ